MTPCAEACCNVVLLQSFVPVHPYNQELQKMSQKKYFTNSMEHEEYSLTNGLTLMVNVYLGSLAGTGGMLMARPYNIRQMDVCHDLPKDHKVKFLPG